MGERKKLHSGEFHDLYSSPNIIREIKLRRMRWAQHVAMHEREVYKVFVEKLKGKRPLRKPRHRWEVGIKMDLKKTGWEGWSGFIWLRIGTKGRLW
jgi:hypothetical protein